MLQPYRPDDFGYGQVHVRRSTNSGFLYRIDPIPGGNVMILILSAMIPDLDYAFHNAEYLLAAQPAEPEPLDLVIGAGKQFKFRLEANPTKRKPGREKKVEIVSGFMIRLIRKTG